MYRIVKLDRKTTNIIDVIYEDIETLDTAEERLIDAVSDSISNFDEYTSCDIQAICEQGYENVNTYSINIEEDGILLQG